MKQLVIMPGGFHPFHAGHLALYNSARAAFPDAEVYVAATNDTSERPFPFAIKEKLAKLAGVEPGHFVQVKSPFQAREITAKYNPDDTILIFVRSEKDRDKPPQPGGTKKDGSLAYLQPIGKNMEPMSQHGYMAYLPTVEFGPGMTSATEIRGAWPTLNEKRKTALVMSLYPKTQKNPKLAQTVVKMLDMAIGGLQEHFPQQLAQGGMMASYQARDNQPIDEVRIHDPKSVDLYFHPDKNSVKKKLVGRNIPARALDMLIQAVCRKYRVYPEDFEWTAAKGSPDPFGRVVDEDYLEERRVKKY